MSELDLLKDKAQLLIAQMTALDLVNRAFKQILQDADLLEIAQLQKPGGRGAQELQVLKTWLNEAEAFVKDLKNKLTQPVG